MVLFHSFAVARVAGGWPATYFYRLVYAEEDYLFLCPVCMFKYAMDWQGRPDASPCRTYLLNLAPRMDAGRDEAGSNTTMISRSSSAGQWYLIVVGKVLATNPLCSRGHRRRPVRYTASAALPS